MAAVAAAVGTLVLAPAALAQTVDYTWTGTGSPNNWSVPGNWTASDLSATAPSGAVRNLIFPALTCSGSAGPCTAYDDITPLSADQLVIDTSTNYLMYEGGTYGQEPITVAGNGGTPNVGLTTTYGNSGAGNPTAVFDLPIQLTGPAQEWDIPKGNLYVTQISDASGQSTPLTVNLGGGANYGYLETGAIDTTGPVTVQGNGDLGLAYGSGLASASLPAVTLNGTTDLTVATNATSGAITATGNGHVQVYGVQGSTLKLASGNLTLGGNSGIDLDVDGDTANLSNSIDVANGSASLGGASLALWQNEQTPYTSCNKLTPGATLTLLTASGGISGSLVVNGQTISQGQSATEPITNECGGSSSTAIITYNANSITATVAGAPALVAGQGPHISGGSQVGDTLTASNGTWTGGPAPTYTYQWLADGSAINGATGSSYTLRAADVGKTISVAVTATNTYGHATANSNGIGPVKAASGSTGTGGTGGTGGTVSAKLVRAALSHLGHPSGRHAIELLLKRGWFRTSFHAPARGTLSVAWRVTVTTGHGKHEKHHTYVVAVATAHPAGARSVVVTIHLTAVGKRLLREHLRNLHVVASERFRPAGAGWTTLVKKFTL